MLKLINKVKKALEDISGCRVNYIRSMTRGGIILQLKEIRKVIPVNSISNHKLNLLQQVFAGIVVFNLAKNSFLELKT